MSILNKPSSIFENINPLYSRYIALDEDFASEMRKYFGYDNLSKIQRIVPESVIPKLNLLETTLINFADENKGKVIPSRVDGKHAGIITIDEIFRGYAERLGNRAQDIKEIPLNFKEMREAIRNDRLSDLMYQSISTMSVEANIADDIRHQFRSEIEEYDIEITDDYVGSSTMPHKINPKDFENVKSFWKAFSPRVMIALFGQITEHQGDSTNEFLADTIFESFAGLTYTTGKLNKAIQNLKFKDKN